MQSEKTPSFRVTTQWGQNERRVTKSYFNIVFFLFLATFLTKSLIIF